MSYILDAIKKADQKRKLGTVPDVQTEHEVPLDEPRRPGWLYGLAAILIVNAVGIGWWLWSGAPAKTPVVQQSEKPAAVSAAPATRPDSARTAAQGKPSPVAPPPASPDLEIQAPALQAAGNFTPQKVVSGIPQVAQMQEGGAGSAAIVPPREAAMPPETPPLSTPAGEAPILAAGEQEAPAPRNDASPGATPAPPPAPLHAARDQRLEEGKPVIPPVVQSEAVRQAPVAPAPSRPGAKGRPAIAAGERGEIAPPKAAKPAEVAPPAPPVPAAAEEDAVAASDEALDEADEAPVEEDEADTETTGVAAEVQALAPIAVSAAGKAKPKKGDKESEDDPELAKIPFLRQLPADIQQSVPELHISFHAYSIKPSSRLVSIGGKILREGQQVGENLTLERITVKGVVLNINGRRFRLEI